MKKYEKPVLEVVEIENDAILSACASGVDNDTALCEEAPACTADFPTCNELR
ncbi:MAG: hypothetical protein IKI24_00850 [Clostridia bacterium]|nr:hypothetical protein [Clostridia bacterium]MCR4578614.1 hypothetical protein [Clostridiales bacterium]